MGFLQIDMTASAVDSTFASASLQVLRANVKSKTAPESYICWRPCDPEIRTDVPRYETNVRIGTLTRPLIAVGPVTRPGLAMQKGDALYSIGLPAAMRRT